MAENAYIEALSKIKKGETRTFGDVAALAGRPSGARAAGRIVSACPSDSRAPWYRAVTAEGGLSIDPERAAMQLEKLRKEGARPKEGESVARWAKRVKAGVVGDWRSRRFAGVNDERIEKFDPRFVEAFASAKAAIARRFEPFDVARGGKKREPKAAAAPPALREAPLPQFEHDVEDVAWGGGHSVCGRGQGAPAREHAGLPDRGARVTNAREPLEFAGARPLRKARVVSRARAQEGPP